MSSQRSPSLAKHARFDNNDLRKRLGFPQNANKWISLLVYPALTPMYVLRRKLGVRMVSLSKLFGACLVMLLFGFIVGGISAGVNTYHRPDMPSIMDLVKGQVTAIVPRAPTVTDATDFVKGLFGIKPEPPLAPEPVAVPALTLGAVWDLFTAKFNELMDPLYAFALLTIALGFSQRLVRWVRRQRGEQLNTKSLGISLIPLPIRNNSIERYLDPMLCIGAGVFVWLSDYPLMGAWIVCCGLSLGMVEKYVHEIQLDQYDALLNAEAHEQITGAYLSGMQRSASASRARKPVSTGMSKDVQERMAKRVKRQSASPAPTPISPMNPSPITLSQSPVKA